MVINKERPVKPDEVQALLDKAGDLGEVVRVREQRPRTACALFLMVT
jgi:hypothetical protein